MFPLPRLVQGVPGALGCPEGAALGPPLISAGSGLRTTLCAHASTPEPQGILEQFWGGGGHKPGSHPNPLTPSVPGTATPPCLHLGRGHLPTTSTDTPITLTLNPPHCVNPDCR